MLCRGRKNVCEGCPSVYGGIQGSEGHESGVSVTSATAEKIQDVDGESYTVYKIRCSVMGVGGEQQEVGTGNGGSPACCWQVCRRYTEFHQLDNLLRSLGTVLLDLPSKNPFASVLGSIRKSRSAIFPPLPTPCNKHIRALSTSTILPSAARPAGILVSISDTV